MTTEPLILANGETAAWQGGRYVASHQGEWHQMGTPEPELPATGDERCYAGIDWQIGVVELADGSWLANPPGWSDRDPRFPSRTAALRHAAAQVIRRARLRHCWRGQYQTRITDEHAATVIRWANRVLGRPQRFTPRPRPGAATPAPPAPSTPQLTLFPAPEVRP